MPGYPIVISAFSHLGLSPAVEGVLLSAAFQFATLAVIWVGFCESRVSAKNLATLGTAAVFPGFVYYAGVFPLSLLTFLTLLAILAAVRRRTGLTALAAAAAAATYPVGAAVAAALAVRELTVPGGVNERLRRSALIAAAGAASLGVVSASQRLMTGHWDSYVLIQRHYGHNGIDPFAVLRSAKEQALSFAHDPHRLSLVPALQLLLVAAFVAAVVATFLVTRHRDDLPVVIFVGLAWLMPLVLGGVSLYRSDAALLPGLLVTRRLPLVVQVLFALVAAAIGFEMTRQFFDGVLV